MFPNASESCESYLVLLELGLAQLQLSFAQSWQCGSLELSQAVILTAQSQLARSSQPFVSQDGRR